MTAPVTVVHEAGGRPVDTPPPISDAAAAAIAAALHLEARP